MAEKNASIGRYLHESAPFFPPERRPADGSPNIVFVVLDDVGFAHLGCYGSDIETKAMDRLAAEGLRYTNFHTTAMCSPTRASLLTGRNPHVAGVGMITEFQNGFPGYHGSISPSCGTLAEVLQGVGYRTFALGKWHLTPSQTTSAAGPFDCWPLGCGFEKYYGFLGASADQFHPHLINGNEHVPVPELDGYHLSEDLVDRAIGYVNDLTAADPGHPFFMYLAFGAVHAPFHAPREYIEKYRGRFDDGWDEARSRILDRQLKMGIVPPETQLAPRNPGIVPWNELGDDERRLYARMQEVFAGYLDHTDAQIGRLIEYLDETGLRENTLVCLLSDNGAAQEGGLTGRSELHFFSDAAIPVATMLESADRMGSETEHSFYPQGWAQVGNTPLKRYKQNTHGGGVRDPLIISWPAGMPAGNQVRTQYHHVIDIVPTILDVANVQPPASLKGITQAPIQGLSMRYSFDSGTDSTPKRRQHYEMWGHRAMWMDGWKAVAYHERGEPFEDDTWELYNLDNDFSECHDLAAEEPGLLAKLIDAWWEEAAAHQVLPLDDRFAGRRLTGLLRRQESLPSLITVRREASIPGLLAPGIPGLPRSVRVDTTLEPGDEGVLLSVGGRFAGYTLFVQDDALHFEFNYYMFASQRVSTSDVPTGDVELGFDFDQVEGRRGTLRLMVNGEALAVGPVDVYPLTTHVEPLEVGEDNFTPVSPSYRCPYRFTGSIKEARISTLPLSGGQVDEIAEALANGQ